MRAQAHVDDNRKAGVEGQLAGAHGQRALVGAGERVGAQEEGAGFGDGPLQVLGCKRHRAVERVLRHPVRGDGDQRQRRLHPGPQREARDVDALLRKTVA